MRSEKDGLNVEFFKILCGFMMIMFCFITVSLAQLPVYLFVNAGQTVDLDYKVDGAYVYGPDDTKPGGILNILDNAIVPYAQVRTGGTLNIKGGVITGIGINNWTGSSVTIHGKYVDHLAKDGAQFNISNNSLDIADPATGWRGDLTCRYKDALEDSVIPFSAQANIQFTVPPTPPTIPVQIDIKPGSDDNTINLGSMGVIPVAILSSVDFFATTVDPETVVLAGAGVAVRGKGNKLLAHEEDVNDDGLMDLVCKVETINLDPDSFQDGSAILTGSTYDGQAIEGSDKITIVP